MEFDCQAEFGYGDRVIMLWGSRVSLSLSLCRALFGCRGDINYHDSLAGICHRVPDRACTFQLCHSLVGALELIHLELL
jgi:hypothetical protein